MRCYRSGGLTPPYGRRETTLLLEIDGVPSSRTLSAFNRRHPHYRCSSAASRTSCPTPAKAFSMSKLCTGARRQTRARRSFSRTHGRTGKRRARCRTHGSARHISGPLITEAVTTAAEYPALPRRSRSVRTASNASGWKASPPMSPATRLPRYRPAVLPRGIYHRRCAFTSAARRGYSPYPMTAAVESLGTIVKTAQPGSYQNIKITTPGRSRCRSAHLTREDK